LNQIERAIFHEVGYGDGKLVREKNSQFERVSSIGALFILFSPAEEQILFFGGE
jgi:hypothetical protein